MSDDVDAALANLFYALLKAGPHSEAIAYQQLKGPWEQMSRRKRTVAVITILLRGLDD